MKKISSPNFSQFSHNSRENATSHQQRCDRLLSSEHLKGWERLFVKTLRDSKGANSRDEEKLAAIESKLGGVA